VLAGRGYVRLPADDPHRLAWHRFYPPGTDWYAPRPAGPDDTLDAMREAAENLTRYRGRTRVIGDREYLHLEDYDGWRDRRVPGSLLDGRSYGLVVPAWNRWVRKNSRSGLVDFHGTFVGAVEHPVPLMAGTDYRIVADPEALRDTLDRRQAAQSELRDLAFYAAVKVAPEDIFTELQREIIDALRRNGPLTADEIASKLSRSRRQLFNPGGLPELMHRDPPVVINLRDKEGYRLAYDPAGGETRMH
jgi:hypothetical protein